MLKNRGVVPGPVTLFQHTLGTHPLNLYQQAIKGFLSQRAGGIAWGVLYGCVVIFLDGC